MHEDPAEGAAAAAYLGAELVHNVAKLVKEGLHLVVLEERGATFPGLGEVGHHSRHRQPALSVRASAAGPQPEAGSVAVLPFPGGR